MPSVFDRVRNIIAFQLNISNGTVTEDAFFLDDLGADSIDRVELVIALENEFGIDISEDDVVLFKQVGDIVKYITSMTV